MSTSNQMAYRRWLTARIIVGIVGLSILFFLFLMLNTGFLELYRFTRVVLIILSNSMITLCMIAFISTSVVDQGDNVGFLKGKPLSSTNYKGFGCWKRRKDKQEFYVFKYGVIFGIVSTVLGLLLLWMRLDFLSKDFYPSYLDAAIVATLLSGIFTVILSLAQFTYDDEDRGAMTTCLYVLFSIILFLIAVGKS